ncbi:MAG: ATP-binding cassette domain-containing protein, partial [Victivallales bacterium]|nr:ATP-binding cassette domain-containing protein [Victivallales bacterium]
ISFSYGDDKVLNDFNLRVEPGKMVALVGPSGSGKSTLATLLLRFYDVDEGSIKVNNIDIRHIKRKEYREKINAVLQEPYLFSGTIYDNIAYGVSGATREKVEEAARQANAHDFIIELRNGYESVVGEHGIGLSGGQKQRIAIARTLLRDPMVLVLDEATSALDNQSEVEVQEALANLSGTRTIIIIAHRLSTIRHADTIVVMNDGKIAEMGDHSELIKKRGLYYELYKKSAVDKTSLNKRGKTPDLIPMPPRNDFKVITPAI